MRDALKAQNRTIEYSICVWGYEGVEDWGNATGNSWRISTDIRCKFLPPTRSLYYWKLL